MSPFRSRPLTASMRFPGPTMPSRRSRRPTAPCISKNAPPRRPEFSNCRPSRDDVGQQLAFDFRDLVLQHQLAFLEALQLKLVERAALDDARDHIFEVPRLRLESRELGIPGFDVTVDTTGRLV